MITISNRLKILANYVPGGSIVADIGTDHGYLPVYLVLTGISPRAIAADIRRGPLEAARANVHRYRAVDKIDLRLGNGLQVLRPGEADTIVIAGMGGGTIRDILQASPEVAAGARRLILQPMADEKELRQFLLQHGWTIVDETLLLEDGRLYLAVAAERGHEEIKDQLMLEIGPRLWEKRHPLLTEHLQRLRQKYRRVLEGLQQSSQPAAREKAAGIKERLAELEKLAKSLQNDKNNMSEIGG
ncbi:tRNA (adenine22-N1)-methyltransferase [Desulforamulus putei DSM 12395]|uniref:tRNA (Adenine22-N1)-methyltransferase n=1 Tax=Desulforamulus putei DSM 12395 TaxID=1121429 RepID=A0A1M5AVA7_9FIRM|nr:class I SAM-dependent methyltransferase [Desulforamulus putei]SHF34191.1 tRNA (adenine22-N1)-methyltransferase [Desulforamulus putei DSM 12395]